MSAGSANPAARTRHAVCRRDADRQSRRPEYARAGGAGGASNLIAAEDTRHTRQLLQSCGIDTPLTSLHEHNEAHKSDELIGAPRSRRIDRAGVRCGHAAHQRSGLRLGRRRESSAAFPSWSIPGPCAAIAALSIAGLPTDRFAFEGFLPAKAGARRERGCAAGAAKIRTLIFYEAPHRLQEVLRDLADILGARAPGLRVSRTDQAIRDHLHRHAR